MNYGYVTVIKPWPIHENRETMRVSAERAAEVRQLMALGLDSFDIAVRLGIRESQVWNRLAKTDGRT